MKKFYILLTVAVLAAAAIGTRWEPASFEERAISLELRQAPPELAELLKNEPLEVQAVVLDYADDELLQLKAQAALVRYPRLAREVFPLYGDRPEFREILRAYGDNVLLPIYYFLRNDVHALTLRHYAGRKIDGLRSSAGRLLSADRKPSAESADALHETAGEARLTPEQRGWYAVNYIRRDGHDFLGQFVRNGEGEPRWIQSERVLEGLSAFFSGGIRELETKVKTEETVTAVDVGWAAVDAFVMVGAVKLLRAGRAAAASGQSIAVSTRTAAVSTRLARGSHLGMRIAQHGKWPALAVAAYMAFRHPSIVSDALADIARMLGLPAGVGLLVGWALILLPALYVASWGLRLIARPAIALLHGMLRLLSWLDGTKRKVDFSFLRAG
jgi:hypothetical protein